MEKMKAQEIGIDEVLQTLKEVATEWEKLERKEKIRREEKEVNKNDREGDS